MSADVRMLPGIDTTPEVFCANLLRHAHKIKRIVCLIEWDENNAVQVCHPPLDAGERAWMKAVFNHEFKVFNDGHDNE